MPHYNMRSEKSHLMPVTGIDKQSFIRIDYIGILSFSWWQLVVKHAVAVHPDEAQQHI